MGGSGSGSKNTDPDPTKKPGSGFGSATLVADSGRADGRKYTLFGKKMTVEYSFKKGRKKVVQLYKMSIPGSSVRHGSAVAQAEERADLPRRAVVDPVFN